ncbi:heparinase II/III family protein [Spongisporangium articulatum]|uniref:Heparinase II/III family protein n=1 Tax=Spongisporangium articulatum TaxID=3362603 RepID=A0ABW8AHR3_9ACTN
MRGRSCARKAIPVSVFALLSGIALLVGPSSAATGATGVRAEDAICNSMHTLKVPTDESAKATAIMAGTVDMGMYGTMKLAKNPNWKPQAGLDTAGDRYMNSLHWALPLLREGTRPGNKQAAAQTARFVALLHDWVADHPVADRTKWINHPQYAGFRLGTFVCAHRLLTDKSEKAWMAAQIKIDLGVLLAAFTTTGANNTMLNAQLAALAGAYEAGTTSQRAAAVANVAALRSTLMNPDGSDIEGAPGYGAYLGEILVRTAKVLTAYGLSGDADATRTLISRQADFLTQASRPDRRIESIGDGELKTIRTGVYPSTSSANWLATKGAEGTRPSTLYSRWQGGYVFGHSGWRAGNRDGLSSFYSLRTSTQAPLTAHRHLDTTSVTFFSKGVSWIGDPGPYRYDGSALRGFITKRGAHSALVPTGSMTTNAPGVVKYSSSSDLVDKTCVLDTAYQATTGVQLLRCVYYLRSLDALVVQDFVRTTGPAPTGSSAVKQQWVLSPMVTSTAVAGGAQLRLDGVTATGLKRTGSFITTGDASVSPAGSTLGVFGTTYGKKADGTVVTVPLVAKAGGATSSVTTVIAPTDAPLSTQTGTSANGRPTLKVIAGADSQRFVLALTTFPS